MMTPALDELKDEGWEDIGFATIYPGLIGLTGLWAHNMREISFKLITESTISKVCSHPTHRMSARSNILAHSRTNTETMKLEDNTKDQKVQDCPVPAGHGKPMEAVTKAKTKRKKITAPESETLFNPPDLRKKITRAAGLSSNEASHIPPRPRINTLDSIISLESEELMELHPRDDELNMELLDYEPSNISRGSSILDDTDGDVKVKVKQAELLKEVLYFINAYLTIPRNPSPNSGTEDSLRRHKRGMKLNVYSQNQDTQDHLKIKFNFKLPIIVFPLSIYYYFIYFKIHCHLLTNMVSMFVPCTFVDYLCE